MFSLIPTPYLILGALVAVIAAASGGYLKGRADANANAQIARLEFALRAQTAQLAEAERQAKAARTIADEAAKREREAATLAVELQEQIDEYVAGLTRADDFACRFNSDDVRSLNRLRGVNPADLARTPDPAKPAVNVR